VTQFADEKTHHLRREDELHLPRRAGAEHGIPTMMGKESAGMSRVKAAIITTQSDSLP
jgi:hypothetical protein